jgi:hypothetical protein
LNKIKRRWEEGKRRGRREEEGKGGREGPGIVSGYHKSGWIRIDALTK